MSQKNLLTMNARRMADKANLLMVSKDANKYGPHV